MAAVFDLKPFGHRETMKMFNRLPEDVQEKLFPPIIRRSIDRVQAAVAQAWSGGVVQERTGRTADAFFAQQPKKKKLKGGLFMYSTELPLREELGIDPKAEWYYPYAVEYGSPYMSAKSPIRKTVNRVQFREFTKIGEEIGKSITKRAKKLAKAARKAAA